MKTASLALSVFLLFFVSISPVLACTQAPNAVEATLEELVEPAHIILVGTVLEDPEPVFVDMGRPVIEQASIQVEAYLKGEGEAEVVIGGFGTMAICRPGVSVGQRASFFVFERPDGLEIWRVYSAEPADIESIRAITKQFFVPEGAAPASFTPSATSTSTMTATRHPTNTASPTVTNTATHTASPTTAPSATHTATVTNTASATDVPTSTPTELVLPPAPPPQSSDDNLLYALGFGLMGIALVGLIFLIVRRRGL